MYARFIQIYPVEHKVKNNRARGPLIAHMNPYHEESMFTIQYKSFSTPLKSILAITQIINKAYEVSKFNQNVLICIISLSDL